MHNKISITDAMEVTGLAASTIERFIEAGYLKATDSEGSILINSQDLSDTFGVEIDIVPEDYTSPTETELEDSSETEPKIETETDFDDAYQADSQPKEVYADDINNDPLRQSTDSVFEKVISLQERLLDEKDSAIKEQLSEIKWLRERIEKLESQAEKDKVLLLSEHQTINKLLDMHQMKRNPFARALDWFGGSKKEEIK